ncbi:hypothetical protein Hdeb2414_s0010g00346821 [Helianthus debilis subsp. tardiflorus]
MSSSHLKTLLHFLNSNKRSLTFDLSRSQNHLQLSFGFLSIPHPHPLTLILISSSSFRNFKGFDYASRAYPPLSSIADPVLPTEKKPPFSQIPTDHQAHSLGVSEIKVIQHENLNKKILCPHYCLYSPCWNLAILVLFLDIQAKTFTASQHKQKPQNQEPPKEDEEIFETNFSEDSAPEEKQSHHHYHHVEHGKSAVDIMRLDREERKLRLK